MIKASIHDFFLSMENDSKWGKYVKNHRALTSPYLYHENGIDDQIRTIKEANLKIVQWKCKHINVRYDNKQELKGIFYKPTLYKYKPQIN